MFDACIIHSIQSDLISTPMVIVCKKEGSWCTCPDNRELNKLTIKNKFLIHVIDELLNELQGAIFFTKLDLRSGYHEIGMRKEAWNLAQTWIGAKFIPR